MRREPIVELVGVSKHYGDAVALDDVTLSIGDGELVAIVGPSGAGKSTLIKLISGEERCSAGAVLIRGRNVTHALPADRSVAVVYQDYSLFPNLTARGNVAYPLEAQHVTGLLSCLNLLTGGGPRAEIDRRVEASLADVDLGMLAARMPSELSGGERQRVAIARALAVEPDVICFDEPFSALQGMLRYRLSRQLATLKEKTGAAFLYVTHNVEEAFRLADRLVVLIDGRIAQVSSPRELYFGPRSREVAQLTGGVTFLTVAQVGPEIDGKVVVRSRSGLPIAIEPPVAEGDDIGIRPQAVKLLPRGDGHAARISEVAFEGADVRYTVELADGESLVALRPSVSGQILPAGHDVDIEIDQLGCFVINGKGILSGDGERV